MYSISEIHRNDLENIFPFARGGRVKMARRARARALGTHYGKFVTDEDKLTPQFEVIHCRVLIFTIFVT